MKKSVIFVLLLSVLFVSCSNPIIPDNNSNDDNGTTYEEKLLTGYGAPSNSIGSNDDLYLDKTNSVLYVKHNGTWKNVASLQGPTGPTGPTGPAGMNLYYYTYTIQASNISYLGVNNYLVTIPSTLFSGAYWSDVWFVANDGSIYRPAPFYANGLWYGIIYNSTGSVSFRSDANLTGLPIYVFYTVATQGKSLTNSQFNSYSYMESMAIK